MRTAYNQCNYHQLARNQQYQRREGEEEITMDASRASLFECNIINEWFTTYASPQCSSNFFENNNINEDDDDDDSLLIATPQCSSNLFENNNINEDNDDDDSLLIDQRHSPM